MRVLRSSLFVAVTALVAAACGDKVNVTPPAVITPTLHGIVVAPATATISVAQTVQLTAAVSADAGVTATVTWTTTNSGVAGVTQTGLVNGVSPGTAGICAAAAATGLTTVSNCAQVVVQPPTTVVPAVLQIASVTVAGNLNNPVPVPPGVTGGQINVSVTVNPGTERMDSVQVTITNAAGVVKVGGTQVFTSAQAAVMRSAADDLSAQALITSLVFSINTAAYVPTTGAVTWPNGNYTIAVVGYGHQGTTAAVNSSTNTWPLLFGNADAWVVTQVLGTTKVANSAAGFAHTTGSVAVSAVPVLYSGLVIGTATVNYGTVACDDFGNGTGASIGQRTLPLAAPATGTFAWTATFPDASVTTTTNNATNRGSVNGYQFSELCASNGGGGEGAWISAAQYTTTNSMGGLGNIALGAALGSPYPITRLDNHAPIGLALLANAGTRTNSWFNDAVLLNGTSAASASNGIVTGATDLNGVGGIVYIATVTGPGGAVMTSTATLAESANNSTYTLSETAADALGNTASTTAGQAIQFGVDRTPPVLLIIGSPALLTAGSNGNPNAAYTADPGTPTTFSATDNTATVGAVPSGFFNLGLTPLSLSEAARTSTSTKWWCPTTGSYLSASSTLCTGVTGWLGSTTTFPANLSWPTHATLDAYFTIAATVTDQAGNTSPSVSTLFAVDTKAITVGLVDAPSLFTANGPATFTWQATTLGLDIALSRLSVGYSAPALNDAFTGAAWAGNYLFFAPDVVVDAWNAATLQTAVTASVTIPNLLTNIQPTTVAGANASILGACPASVGNANLNQPWTSTGVGLAIGGCLGSPTPTAITNAGGAAGVQGPINWFICNVGGTCGSSPAMPVAGTITISRSGTGFPASAVITAVAEGLSASSVGTPQFANPFASVQFWVYDPANTAAAPTGWRLLATVFNPSSTTDATLAVPGGRNWQFSTTWAPTALNAPDNATYEVVAMGVVGTALPAAQQNMALATPIASIRVAIVP